VANNKKFVSTKSVVQRNNLNTVCEEAMCPNISECWSYGTATFMLMGSVCTRACKFCAVDTGNPNKKLDLEEPKNISKSIKLMDLTYAVLTSVNRDDLEDGGAGHYAKTIEIVKKECPGVIVEALVPDFCGAESSVAKILNSGVDVFAQNIETVERLTYIVRDPRAGYQQTLKVLNMAKKINPKVLTKTSLMLGLGETDLEIENTMDNILASGVDVLTLGQYLRPTLNHLPITRWVTPEEFKDYRSLALLKGFSEVSSGPLVRSSYRADKIAHLINK
jgi:lipoic acid synthetase